MTQQATELTVHKAITVNASQERAFAVFTEQMGTWWPLESKAIGATPAQTAVVEPRAGGRWFERAGDGSECDWGRVIAYEPPGLLVLDWQIGADWRHDATLHTELEVRFVAEDEHTTRVELVHRGLEAYGDDAAQMHAIFGSAQGWGEILDRYAGAARS